MVGMRLHKVGKRLRRATLCQRTKRVEVGHQHRFVGTEDFVRFAHKVYPAHHDDVGIGRSGLLCERKTVAHKIGNILQGAVHVVVGKNDRIFLLSKAADFGFQIYARRNGFVYITFFNP